MILVLFALSGCSEEKLGSEIANQPPETIVSNAPPAGTLASYRVEINWYGIDDDGEILCYFYAWDDTSTWTHTTSGGSTFVLSADGCVACDHTDTQYLEPHTFWIKAMDDRGTHDPTPAHRTFTAETTAPITTIIRGPCDRNYCSPTGRDVFIEWVGNDPDGGVVDSFYYRMNPGPLTSMVDSSWARVPADCTYVLYDDIERLYLSTGRYNTFAVVAKDHAGAMERVLEHGRNWCCFDPIRDETPKITIWGGILGDRNNRADGGPLSEAKVGEVFLGVEVSFRWEADASRYGSRIAGYRYAFDDTTQWPQWYAESTRYPTEGEVFLPTVGNHSLYVQAIDTIGGVSVCCFRFHVEPGPAVGETYPILLVDDSKFSGHPNSVGDWAAHDADAVEAEFFRRILKGYSVAEWDCLDQIRKPPPVSLVGRHRTVIWYTDDYDDEQSELYEMFHGGTRYLDPYVKVGGNLIVFGVNPAKALDKDCRGAANYPFQYDERFCTWGPPVPISYWALGLSTLFVVHQDSFRGAASRFPDTYPNLPISRPWPHISGTDTLFLWAVEAFNPDGINPNVNAIPIYDFDYFIPEGLDPDAVQKGQNCALIVDNSGNSGVGSTAYFGWPLIWCDWDSVAVMMEKILTDVFDEPAVGR